LEAMCNKHVQFWSVADGVSLLVSTSKLVCRILSNSDESDFNITTISNSFSPSYTSYSTYVVSFASLRKNAKRMGRKILLRNFAKCSPV